MRWIRAALVPANLTMPLMFYGQNWCNLEVMNAILSPIVSEFENEEQAASYDSWFRAQVQDSLEDPSPSIPHDQVMAEMREIIAKKRAARKMNATENKS